MGVRSGLLTYGLGHATTGISRYTAELARALASLEGGPQLALLTAGGPGPLVGMGLDRAALPGCRLLPGLMTLGNAEIPLLARRMGLDIVHDPIGVAPFLFGAGGARSVVTVHDAFPWVYPATSTLLESLVYRHWLPRMLPRVDAVITDSQASRADIAQYLKVSPVRIKAIPLGVNDAYRPASPQRVAEVASRYGLPGGYILYLGSTRKHKNLVGLLSAYDRLQRMGPTPPLVLLGVSPQECAAVLVEILGDSGLQQSIAGITHVAEADLPALYSGARLLVRPVLYEGFGLPPLEAMACGTPVVCSNVASLPEVVGDAAITVDPADVEALAGAMQRVLSDRDLHQELRRRGLERAAGFTWERAARQTVAVYEGMLRG
jgi:glycosyltransferase involved in cell wall biosynthesis